MQNMVYGVFIRYWDDNNTGSSLGQRWDYTGFWVALGTRGAVLQVACDIGNNYYRPVPGLRWPISSLTTCCRVPQAVLDRPREGMVPACMEDSVFHL